MKDSDYQPKRCPFLFKIAEKKRFITKSYPAAQNLSKNSENANFLYRYNCVCCDCQFRFPHFPAQFCIKKVVQENVQSSQNVLL